MRAFYWSIAKLKMKRKKNKNTTGLRLPCGVAQLSVPGRREAELSLIKILFLLHLLNTEPVLPFQATTDAPLLLRPRGPGDVKQSYNLTNNLI